MKFTVAESWKKAICSNQQIASALLALKPCEYRLIFETRFNLIVENVNPPRRYLLESCEVHGVGTISNKAGPFRTMYNNRRTLIENFFPGLYS
jgi:hypothetical protein